MESGFSFCGRCPQSPTKRVTPLEPDTKTHEYAFSIRGAGELFPCWEFEGETLKGS